MGALLSGSSLVVLLLWVSIMLLLLYIQAAQQELAPFDPYSIMQLGPDATEKEVKRQYRELARVYHPDKNPDPKAAEYFDQLVKAYKALTDETARENYKKYGHPDGPQAMNIGVAMPSFLFNADKKTAPLMLLGLVGFGILLPLIVAACYLTKSNKYAGPNQVQHETLGLWMTHPKFGIKESQGLRRIPDTLVVAKEFIDMPVPSDQGVALEELKKVVTRYHTDLKDIKKDFWKRKSSIVKAHMLLLAFLERAEDEVPDILQTDLKFVLQHAPRLLAELMNVAVYPRKQFLLYGWMVPHPLAVYPN
jgi:translocation protein SEC63